MLNDYYFFPSHHTFTYQLLRGSVKEGLVSGKRKWQENKKEMTACIP